MRLSLSTFMMFEIKAETPENTNSLKVTMINSLDVNITRLYKTKK